jgi:hypothetical protein
MDVIHQADLAAQAELFAANLLRAGALTAAELAALRPGAGAAVPDTAEGWLGFLIQLHRRHAVLHARTPAGGGEAAVDPIDRVALEALAERPAVVTLLVPPDAAHAQVALAPKSWQALTHCWDRDGAIAWLSDLLESATTAAEPPDYAWLAQAREELIYQQALQVWAFSHPGPQLPWDPAGPPPATVPAWILALDARDVLHLQIVAHQQHAEAFRALGALQGRPVEGTRRRPLPWATFFGAIAAEAGVPAATLIRDRSLVAVLAQARAAAAAAQPDPDERRAAATGAR